MEKVPMYVTVETAFGLFSVCGSDEGVTRVLFPGQTPPPGYAAGENAVLREAARQLKEYFEGERTAFDVPLNPQGTPFMLRAWDVLRGIPYGQTATYGALAKAVSSMGGARAVGRACARNPIPIIVPCHRVVGADGSLTGFAGGVQLKERLLKLEGARE